MLSRLAFQNAVWLVVGIFIVSSTDINMDVGRTVILVTVYLDPTKWRVSGAALLSSVD